MAGAGLSAASARMIERRLAEVPGAEWWDLPLLNASSYEGPPGGSLAANAVLEGISHLIEHPVPIAPPNSQQSCQGNMPHRTELCRGSELSR